MSGPPVVSDSGDVDGPVVGGVPATEGDGRPSGRAHRPWVVALIVLGAVVMLVASVSTWAKRQALDTDQWVKASDELLANAEIRGVLSQYLVDELYASVDVGAQLEDRLPQDFQRLAPTIAAALRGPATEAVDRLLATDQARAIWETANRRGHAALVRVLRDETRLDATSTAGGDITLDLRELVANLATRLGLPESVIARIPQDAGQIVVVRSDRLAAAQTATAAIEVGSVVLFFVVVALFAAAVALAGGWRRLALRDVGIAVVVVGLVVLVIQRVMGNYLTDNFVEVQANRDVAFSVWAIATGLLRDIGWNSVAVGVVVILAASLAGPSRPARAVRRFVSPVMVDNPGMLWGATAALFGLLVLWAPLPVLATWFGALTLAVVLAVAVEGLRRRCLLDADEMRAAVMPTDTDRTSPVPAPRA